MKKFIFIMVILFFYTSVGFTQTAVRVPSEFIGVWSADYSYSIGDLKFFPRIVIHEDGAWILGIKYFAINQAGHEKLSEMGLESGSIQNSTTGVVTSASSVGIILTELGRNVAFATCIIDGNNLSISGLYFPFKRGEPQF